MLRFHSEYFYIWGHALISILLVLITCIASAVIIRHRPSIGVLLLIAGALLVSGSLFLGDVGWLILAGGDGVIDGLKEPRRSALLDDLRPIEDGMIYLGTLAVVSALLIIGKDLVEMRRRSELVQDADAGSFDGDEPSNQN